MRGAALYGSNMENYELLTQGQHVDEGKLSGPVVNSPRQLWSVAAYLAIVTEGVFGLTEDGSGASRSCRPRWCRCCSATRDSDLAHLPDRRITLELPKQRNGNLLVADRTHAREGNATTVHAQGDHGEGRAAAHRRAAVRARRRRPHRRSPPTASSGRCKADGKVQLYVNGKRAQADRRQRHAAAAPAPSPASAPPASMRTASNRCTARQACVGELPAVTGDWPRTWTAPASGSLPRLARTTATTTARSTPASPPR